MKVFKLAGKRVENDYQGSGHAVLVAKEDRPLRLFYTRDFEQNNKGNIDIDVMEVLKANGIDANDLRDTGHNIYLGMASSHEFVVLNKLI